MGIWANFIKSDFQQKMINRMSFPTRMLVVIIVVIIVVNLIEFCWLMHLALAFVLSVSIVEILAITINFAYWVPQYKLKW